MINIPQNPGALPDPFSPKDYIYERRAEIFGAPQVNWDKGFEVEEAKDIKIENQNGSSSCTGQAISKYCEVLEKIENKNFIDLSAKFIYSQVALPQSGAYIRDAIAIPVKQGIALESDLPSYPATEENMIRKEDIIDEIRQRALIYQAKEYYSTWHKNDIDLIASLITEGHGCIMGARGVNSGWQNEWVSPIGIDEAGSAAWGHAFYACGYFKKDNKKYIRAINSWGSEWGDYGFFNIGQDYIESGHVFSIWLLLDKLNIIINPGELKNMELRKKPGDERVFAVANNKRFHILSPSTLNAGMGSAWQSWENIIEDSDLDILPFGGAIFIAPDVKDPLN